MATSLRLTFTDGSERTVRLSARALILAERKYGADMPKIEGTFYTAWAVIRPGVDFDTWLETVDDFVEAATDNPPVAAQPEASPVLPPPSE